MRWMIAICMASVVSISVGCGDSSVPESTEQKQPPTSAAAPQIGVEKRVVVLDVAADAQRIRRVAEHGVVEHEIPVRVRRPL